MGMLHILGPDGDEVRRWDPADGSEVARVRAEFDGLVARNWLAYATGPYDQRDAEPIAVRVFDPSAERIVLTPPLAGG